MKDYAAKNIRNFAIVGHGGSGKTMLAEAMLSKSGEINRLGTIEAGTTVSDYHQDEHERQISIHSSRYFLEKFIDEKLQINNHNNRIKKIPTYLSLLVQQ